MGSDLMEHGLKDLKHFGLLPHWVVVPWENLIAKIVKDPFVSRHDVKTTDTYLKQWYFYKLLLVVLNTLAYYSGNKKKGVVKPGKTQKKLIYILKF